MKIERFAVERWMDLYEGECELNLAETCVDPMTLQELLDLCGVSPETVMGDLLRMRLTYGAINGTPVLRGHIASLFRSASADQVLVAHGAIGANALVYAALVGPGDHVVAVTPTYQQHRSIPESLGATVDLLPLREENGFQPDLAELERLVRADTKLIVLNNPNNPTGALMDEAMLRRVAEIARAHGGGGGGAYVLCDEVYRGLDDSDDGDGFTTSIVDVYERGISTGSMTKTYSLAGLRLGWVVTADREALEAVLRHRDYNTISVGMIDDYLACLALAHRGAVLKRSHRILRENRAILAEWVAAQEGRVTYTAPRSGTTVLLKYHVATDTTSWDLCVRIVKETGVMLSPGSALDMEGYLRLGYANKTEILRAGLAKLGDFLKTL